MQRRRKKRQEEESLQRTGSTVSLSCNPGRASTVPWSFAHFASSLALYQSAKTPYG